MRINRRLTSIGGLACAIVLSACDVAGSPAGTGAFLIKPSQVKQAVNEILLKTGKPGSAAPDNAMEVLTKTCMKSHKLIYIPQFTPAARATAQMRALQEYPPYGTLQQRERDGYGLAADTASSRESSQTRASDAEDILVNRLTPSARAHYEQVEYGTSSDLNYLKLFGSKITIRAGGCRQWAANQIFGSIENYLIYNSALPLYYDKFLQMVRESAPVTEALRQWSACMSKRGLHYRTPNDAYFSIARQYIDGAAKTRERAREITVAVADYECANKVALVPVTQKEQQALAAHLAGTPLAPVLDIAKIDIYAANRSARFWPMARK